MAVMIDSWPLPRMPLRFRRICANSQIGRHNPTRSPLVCCRRPVTIPLPAGERGLPVVTRTVEYRGYEIIINPPAKPGGGWRVLIWPKRSGPPIPMSTYPSEDETLQAARDTVDRELDGPRAVPDQLHTYPSYAK